MKTLRHVLQIRKTIAKCASRWVCGLGLAACISTARAADDYVVDTFDSSGSAGQWSRWWGSAGQSFAWDGAVDANGNANSGSLKVTINFNLASYSGDNQFAILRPFPTVVAGSEYTNLVFDLLWDQGSPRNASDFGYMEPGFRNQDYSQNWLTPFNVPTTTGWQHIVLPINPAASKIDTINGVVLKMWSGNASSGFTGTTTFWVDNVKLVARTDTTVPPPVMGIGKVTPGLRIFASAPGAQYSRQSIRTKNAQYSWVGATDPVTYSITVGNYPASSYSGFQTHLFIVPGTTTSVPNYETSPDWNEANLIFLQIANNADGSAYAAFRYKTNQPNGNSMLFGSGTIATVGSATPKGTWNLTFNPDGQISLSSPSGGTTNFALPTDAANLFAGSAMAYFGIQPNSVANIGQSATLAQIQITGVANPVSDNFNGSAVDTATWEIVADDVTGLQTIPQDTAFEIYWTVPDKGFVLNYFTDITAGLTEIPFGGLGVQAAGYRRQIVRQSELPASSTVFFRLQK
jgi:hypothetical protein